MRTWLVADFNFYCWRAFYGRGGRDPGQSVAEALAGVEEARDRFFSGPTDVIYCFDRGPYVRSALFPGYKAGRAERDSDPEEAEGRRLLREAVDAEADRLRGSGAHVLWAPGFEADDHAAQAARQLPRRDRVVIASRDRDLLQCVSDSRLLFDPVTGSVTGLREFRRGWELHPSEWVGVKALAGCPSDDVPGVPGCGEKTAAKFLRGELNQMHAVAMRIKEWMTTANYRLNLSLCALPFPGTPPLPLRLRDPGST